MENLKMCSLMGYFFQNYVMFELKKNTEKFYREKWLMVSKMSEEIWWIFTVVESNVR